MIKIMTEAIWRRRGEIASPPARTDKEEGDVPLNHMDRGTLLTHLPANAMMEKRE